MISLLYTLRNLAPFKSCIFGLCLVSFDCVEAKAMQVVLAPQFIQKYDHRLGEVP